MYWNTILNHPQHTRRDAQEGLDVLARKLNKLTQITDLNQRLEQLAVFIEIESIRKSPIGKDFFVKWEEAAFALYDQAADNAGRMWAIIAMVEKPWFEQIDSKRRRELIKNLKTYARAPELKGEYKAWEAFTKVHAAAKAAKNTEQNKKLVPATVQSPIVCSTPAMVRRRPKKLRSSHRAISCKVVPCSGVWAWFVPYAPKE